MEVFPDAIGPHGPSVGQMVGKLPGVVTLTCVGSSFVRQLYGYLAFYPQSVVEITGPDSTDILRRLLPHGNRKIR